MQQAEEKSERLVWELQQRTPKSYGVSVRGKYHTMNRAQETTDPALSTNLLKDYRKSKKLAGWGIEAFTVTQISTACS